jgi:hypothetical protein
MTTKHPRKTSLGKLAAGALVAVGMVVAAGSSAMADSWKHNNGHGNGHWNGHGNGHGNKHWKQSRYQYDHGHGGYYYQPRRPKVVYVQPQPVYVAPPPVYYYQPAPVYRRPEINIVFPLDFD